MIESTNKHKRGDGRDHPYQRDGEMQSAPVEGSAGVLFGVLLINGDGSESGHSERWERWKDAANFGEGEVKARRARGFRVFKEPSTQNTD